MGGSAAALSVNVENDGRSLLRDDMVVLLMHVLIHVAGNESVVLSKSTAHAARDRDRRQRAEAAIPFMTLDAVV